MKNLMAKIKGADYKGLFLRHGEKMGMGVTALIAVVCLFLTNWKGYATTPDEMKNQAQQMETKLRSNVWPAEKRATFVPVTAEQAIASLVQPVNLANFSHSVNMSPKLYTYKQPADDPVVVTVTALQVSSGQMPLDVVPPITDEVDESASEEPFRAAGRNDRGVNSRDRGGDRGDRLSGRDAAVVKPGMFPGDRPGSPTTRAAVDKLGGGSPTIARGGAMKRSILEAGDEPAGVGAGGVPGSMGIAAGKARGVRYNVITGVVDRKKQLELLRSALHLETAGEVPEYLEYVDFKIQRQRAQPGPKPWSDDPGSWKDVDTTQSIDLLVNEATDFDPDVVSAEYINDAITSPLPHRLDGDWDFAEVGHPAIPMLNLEGRELEAYMNLLSEQIAAEAGLDDEEARFTRGFRRAQKDPTQMRQRALSVDGGATRMNDMRRQMQDVDDDDQRRGRGVSILRGGGANVPRGRPSPVGAAVPGRRPGAAPRSAMTAGDEYGGGAYGGGAYGGATVADSILFRYFDFDIEPGECYRYRVQIIISNPNEDEEFVSSPEVAVGYDRASEWSKPSPAVIVPRDVEYSLARIARRSGRRDGATLNVVQFDTDAGTLVADSLPLKHGAYVAGTKQSDHLNLAIPSFLPEEVNFTSKEILVDSAGGPAISASVAQDLKLSSRQVQKLVDGGALDQAVTLNRFGELVSLDASAKPEYQYARDRYKKQAEEYAELKEESTAQAALEKLGSRDMLGQIAAPGDDGAAGGRRMGLNPLKRRGGMDQTQGGQGQGRGRRRQRDGD